LLLRRFRHQVTETARRVARLAAPHARGRAAGAAVAALGLGLASAAVGIALAPALWGVAAGWILVFGAAAAGWWGWRREARRLSPTHVGALVERSGQGRAGSIVGLMTAPQAGSSDLWAVADGRAATQVDRAASLVERELAGGTRTVFYYGAGAVLAGA